MMKISMICFSLTGQETGEHLVHGFRERGYESSLAKKSKYLSDSIAVSTEKWAGEQFQQADAILFIGACGIAVRSIAPYIVGKKTDPAVLVVDECGKFVISLLSGHLGGANDLTAQAAEILDGVPVVTTATDLHHRFAVDMFAKKNQCSIFHMKAAKEASAALLANQEIGFYSEFPWEGELPRGLIVCDREGYAKLSERHPGLEESGRNGEIMTTEMREHFSVGVAVTVHRDCLPFPSTVQVVPRVAAMGLGCRKSMAYEQIKKAAEQSLDKLVLYREAVCCLASIELKKEEPGILALAEQWQVPFETFSDEELREVRGSFTPSAFVKEITGVDNVCERSAVLAAERIRSIHTQRDGLMSAGRNPVTHTKELATHMQEPVTHTNEPATHMQEHVIHTQESAIHMQKSLVAIHMPQPQLIQNKSAAAGVTTAVALGDWRIHFE